MGSRIYTLACAGFVLAVMSAAPSGCASCQNGGLNDGGGTPTFTFERPDPALRWIRAESPVQLTKLVQSPVEGRPLVRYPSCESQFPGDSWGTREDALASLHDSLSRPTDAVESGVHDSGWVTITNDPSFAIAFTSAAQHIGSDIGADYGQVSLSAGLEGENTSVRLALASIGRTVRLTDAAKTCVIENVCRATPEGGTIPVAARYGALITLSIGEAKLSTAADVSADPFGSVSFELSAENVDIAFGLIGRVDASYRQSEQDVREVYDVPEILNDLQTKKLLKVAETVRSRTETFGIVSLSVEDVSDEVCRELLSASEDGGATTRDEGGTTDSGAEE